MLVAATMGTADADFTASLNPQEHDLPDIESSWARDEDGNELGRRSIDSETNLGAEA
jgi:hypothetical protein